MSFKAQSVDGFSTVTSYISASLREKPRECTTLSMSPSTRYGPTMEMRSVENIRELLLSKETSLEQAKEISWVLSTMLRIRLSGLETRSSLVSNTSHPLETRVSVGLIPLCENRLFQTSESRLHHRSQPIRFRRVL